MPFYRFAFVGLLAVSGCSNLVPSTLVHLNRLDPFTADPAGFAAGLETSSGLALLDGSETWTFEATHSPSGETRALVADLVKDGAQDGLTVYRLSDADVAALRQWQQELVVLRETSDGNGSLSLTFGAKGCRISGATIPDDPTVSIFVQLATDAPMRPFARNVPVMAFFGAERADIDALPVCEGGPF